MIPICSITFTCYDTTPQPHHWPRLVFNYWSPAWPSSVHRNVTRDDRILIKMLTQSWINFSPGNPYIGTIWTTEWGRGQRSNNTFITCLPLPLFAVVCVWLCSYRLFGVIIRSDEWPNLYLSICLCFVMCTKLISKIDIDTLCWNAFASPTTCDHKN